VLSQLPARHTSRVERSTRVANGTENELTNSLTSRRRREQRLRIEGTTEKLGLEKTELRLDLSTLPGILLT
jgi:hypothetical protein